ncbi:MAG: isoprenylcysteine carboxylmethyltransferase family protein [Anaerolineales bacterium]|jgi:protein-S-isoprenylcysteine O-methyltransferase Ste14
MTYDQIFLAAILSVFLLTFIITLVFVRVRGYDPKGVIDGHVGGAIVTSGATLLWLVVTLFYIFEARSINWFGRIAILDYDIAKGVGFVISIIGLIVSAAGEVTLRESFCVALPTKETDLVSEGIYRYIRNPCALGAILLALGTFFIAPSLLAFVAFVANVVGYEMKIKVEEGYLRRTHGAAYESYRARTGRYLPFTKRRRKR